MKKILPESAYKKVKNFKTLAQIHRYYTNIYYHKLLNFSFKILFFLHIAKFIDQIIIFMLFNT